TRFSRDWSSDVCSSDLMLRSIDLARSQITREHRLAAEHAQRQIPVVVVVGVELALLLRTVRRHVRGVNIENDLLGRRFVRSEKRSEERRAGKECNHRVE